MTSLEQQILDQFDFELSLGGRAAQNYALLDQVLRKDLPVDGLPTYLLFNPSRVHSVMADVSPKALAARACFLCPQGLEDKQQSLQWQNYYIRVNPFPIFRPHFTISSVLHEPQRIAGHYANMLTLAQELPSFTIFYNGPRCGASAPDHMHFQAIPARSLPLQVWCDEHIPPLLDIQRKQTEASGETTIEANEQQYKVCQIPVFCPSAYLLQSYDAEEIERQLFRLIDQHGHDFNIVTWTMSTTHEYRSLIFFRSKSRPDCFFETDETKRILFSPATVEMAGVGVVSSQDSFDKIDATRFKQLIHEVSLQRDK